MSDLLFVYGTLQDDYPEAVMRGFSKRTDAPYPTIEPTNGVVRGQVRKVEDWEGKDRYEGYRPDDPENSLYWRLISSNGVHVYVGNPEVARRHWNSYWHADYDYEQVREAVASTEVIY